MSRIEFDFEPPLHRDKGSARIRNECVAIFEADGMNNYKGTIFIRLQEVIAHVSLDQHLLHTHHGYDDNFCAVINGVYLLGRYWTVSARAQLQPIQTDTIRSEILAPHFCRTTLELPF
jgi:hypothetical protein